MAELELIRQRKLIEVFPGLPGDVRLEASGVCAAKGVLFVVFDNMAQVVRLTADLKPAPGRAIVAHSNHEAGYEDLGYDEASGRFLALVESELCDDGLIRPRLDELDESLRLLEKARLDLTIEDANKGLEGLTVIQRNGDTYIVTLCEGNLCRAGKRGRAPGGGRLPVFRRDGGGWQPVAICALPESLPFEDFAAVDVKVSRLAVFLAFETIVLFFARVLIVWIYEGTGRSVLLVCVFHASFDATISKLSLEIIPASDTERFLLLNSVIVLAAGAVIIATSGRVRTGPR